VVLFGSAAYASVRQKEMADKDQKSSSKVEKELHEGEKQSMVEKVIRKIASNMSFLLLHNLLT
jgi:hypothetical protein